MRKDEFIEADDYYDMGYQWMLEQEYDKAISCFRHAISLNRKFTYAYIDLAAAYAKKGEYGEAVSVLKKGIKADPGFDILYYKTARYLYSNEEYYLSLKFIEEALSRNDTELYRRVRDVILKKTSERGV